jgi:acyl carrier protein
MSNNLSNQEIQDRVVETIENYCGIKPELSHSLEDLGLDSLDELELVMELEDEFEFEIPDEDASNFKTVDQVVIYITEKLSA